MTENEVKKLLYKAKPIAERFAKTQEHSFYDCIVDGYQIHFVVPISEGDFGEQEKAQLLIRWFTKVDVLSTKVNPL